MDVFYIKLACLRAFLTVNTVFCFMVIVLIIPKCVVCLTRSSNSCTKDFFCNCNYATFSPPDVLFFFLFFTRVGFEMLLQISLLHFYF